MTLAQRRHSPSGLIVSENGCTPRVRFHAPDPTKDQLLPEVRQHLARRVELNGDYRARESQKLSDSLI